MNLEKIDNVLKRAAVVLGLMGGAAFTGLYPIWVGVIASFAGVLCGALATSPVFSVTPEAGWNRAMQALAAVFTAAAGSSQLEAVQKFVAPGHPVLAAKLGLGVMLGAQVFAYLAQRGAGAASQSAGPALVLLLALAVGSSGCAAVMSNLPQVIAEVQDAELVIGMIQRIVDAVFVAHPDPKSQAIVDGAIQRVISAADLVNRAAQGAQDLDGAQTDAAFKEFEAAWNDLQSILGPYAISFGDAPRATRTASGGYVLPRPVLLARAARK